MSDFVSVTGRCLCGAVTIRADKAQPRVEACHCTICRKWGGGPMMAVRCESVVTIEGEDNLTVYDSSSWAQRGFCKNCGTHLFYRVKQKPFYEIPAGLLDNAPDLTFTTQIFVDEQPPYYAFANETVKRTGAEIFAEIQAQQ